MQNSFKATHLVMDVLAFWKDAKCSTSINLIVGLVCFSLTFHSLPVPLISQRQETKSICTNQLSWRFFFVSLSVFSVYLWPIWSKFLLFAYEIWREKKNEQKVNFRWNYREYRKSSPRHDAFPSKQFHVLAVKRKLSIEFIPCARELIASLIFHK